MYEIVIFWYSKSFWKIWRFGPHPIIENIPTPILNIK